MHYFILLTLLIVMGMRIIVKAQTDYGNTSNMHARNARNFRNNNSDFNNYSHRNVQNDYYNEYSTTSNYFKTSRQLNSSTINSKESRNFKYEINETPLNYRNTNDRVRIFENSQQSENNFYETFNDKNPTRISNNNVNLNNLNKKVQPNQEYYISEIDRNYLGNKNINSDENSEENYRSTQKSRQHQTTKPKGNGRLATTTTRKSNTNRTKKTSTTSNNYSSTVNFQQNNLKTKSTSKNYDNVIASLFTTKSIRNYGTKNNSKSNRYDFNFITTPTTFLHNDFGGKTPSTTHNRISTAKSRITTTKKRISQRKYEEYMKSIFDHKDEITLKIASDEFDGRDVAEPGQYPHMAAIGFKTTTNSVEWQCGGSLIDEYFIITAAHCTEINGQKPFYVKIGAINLKINEKAVNPQSLSIQNIYKHPKYTKFSYYNDIALIKLSRRALFTEFVYPIRLWERNTVPYKKVFAMGYGATKFGKAKTNILTHLNLTLVSNTECNNNMPKINETKYGIVDSQICAFDPIANRDTCQGDSGGPLQLNMEGDKRIEYVLIGITSYGLGCGGPLPSVYTRVSTFLDWIEDVVWPN